MKTKLFVLTVAVLLALVVVVPVSATKTCHKGVCVVLTKTPTRTPRPKPTHAPTKTLRPHDSRDVPTPTEYPMIIPTINDFPGYPTATAAPHCYDC